MATFNGNEKQSLGSFVKNQTKYGTTTTAVSKNRASSYVKHYLIPGDTFAGLALKYSVTVEQIKRDNKLWTSDSLFLKEFVFIPVTRENSENLPHNAEVVNQDFVKSALNLSHKLDKNDVNQTTSDSPSVQGKHATKVVKNSTQSNGTSESESENKASPLDFLSKYDSSIAQIKTSVDKMKQNAAFLEKDFPMAASWFPRRHTEGNVSSPRRSSRSHRHSSYEVESDSSPILVIRSRTRDVQSSLERLEQKNDDFYQL